LPIIVAAIKRVRASAVWRMILLHWSDALDEHVAGQLTLRCYLALQETCRFFRRAARISVKIALLRRDCPCLAETPNYVLLPWFRQLILRWARLSTLHIVNHPAPRMTSLMTQRLLDGLDSLSRPTQPRDRTFELFFLASPAEHSSTSTHAHVPTTAPTPTSMHAPTSSTVSPRTAAFHFPSHTVHVQLHTRVDDLGTHLCYSFASRDGSGCRATLYLSLDLLVYEEGLEAQARAMDVCGSPHTWVRVTSHRSAHFLVAARLHRCHCSSCEYWRR
jgi:hypothetical protein